MNEDQKAVAAEMLLEAYFATRFPVKPNGNYVVETKTSFDISQELSDMLSLSNEDVTLFMVTKGFRVVTVEDGSPRWQVYRQIE